MREELWPSNSQHRMDYYFPFISVKDRLKEEKSKELMGQTHTPFVHHSRSLQSFIWPSMLRLI